ncbi:Gamma-glutamyltranspeptidase 1 [Hypsibius exemplaris]|uniref:Gamma-glutamyltranspeptidase 1 n=1 Tax=Hypsibius exemplaris TaxID=2072580 RepID=A0A1W0WAW5_HYPEX|nr:Gamma-glutamyltranspeptidase 1 [Hypsibius exemplaris]
MPQVTEQSDVAAEEPFFRQPAAGPKDDSRGSLHHHNPKPQYFRYKLFGILSVLSVSALILLGLSTSSRTLWSGSDHRHDHSTQHGSEAEVEKPVKRLKVQRQQNSTDDFDLLAERMAAGWPRGSTVKAYDSQAVASDVTSCSTVGNDILNLNGSAADAVIASALCMGVVHPYSSGLGGGVFIMYYDRASRSVFTVDGRETAPLAATEEMFNKVDNNSLPLSPLFGWHSLCVPGELAGMWALHQRFGRLPWAELFGPALKLAREGVTITPFFGTVLAFNKKYLLNVRADENMRELLIDKETGSTLVEGDVIRMPVLADTLETIANDPFGVREFYNGSIGERIVKDVQEGGGILQMEDLQNYQVLVEAPIATTLRRNLTLYGLGPPSGNVLLHYMINILEGYNYDQPWSEMSDDEKVLFYHRLLETMKFGFAQRTKLADPAFIPTAKELAEKMLNPITAEEARQKINDTQAFDDPAYYGGESIAEVNTGGTAHVSVMDNEGNAVSYSTSLNNIFGSYRVSKSTGIMLNNHMDDFTTTDQPNIFGVPPSKANKIAPGKRPQSSMTPALIVDGRGYARVVAGGSGGTRIVTGILNILTRILYFKEDLKSALNAPRLHHQLFPAEVEYEKRFNEAHVDSLRKKGHKMVRSGAPQKYPYSAVEVVYANTTDGKLYAVSDGRKGGLPDGL